MESASRGDQRLEAILLSDEFRTWTERLVPCFDDKARRDTLVREVQEAVARDAAGLPPEDAVRLQSEVVDRLFRSAKSDEPQTTRRTAEELEDFVIEQFPQPIAHCYALLTGSEPGKTGYDRLLAVFQSLLHYLTTVVLSAYWREGATDPAHNGRLYEKFYHKGKWTDGDLMEMLRETVRLYLDRPDALPYPQLVGYLFKPTGEPTTSRLELERFLTRRNDSEAI